MNTISGEIKELEISHFDYHLPEEKIAVYPLAQRDQSRLLIYKEGKISEDIYAHIANYLPSNTHIIFNNTKVVQARLNFLISETKAIEIFCLEPPDSIELNKALQQQKQTHWKCLIGGARKWKSGTISTTVPDVENSISLSAEMVRKEMDCYLLKFSWTPEQLSFAEVLNAVGKVPLPPYIKRDTEKEDKERYQTVYALHEGSVAAPTAGLHFTPAVLQSLRDKNIS
ncbi:MAG TPA: S-adenosylmethionine:tRNA ribosyltransferase-isomerase, partial [Cytophagaceae bacterium]